MRSHGYTDLGLLALVLGGLISCSAPPVRPTAASSTAPRPDSANQGGDNATPDRGGDDDPAGSTDTPGTKTPAEQDSGGGDTPKDKEDPKDDDKGEMTNEPKLPKASLLFIGGGSEAVAVYKFDRATGATSLLKTVATPGAWLTFLDAHPGSRRLFGVNERGSEVLMYGIDYTSGALTKLAQLPTANGPAHVSVDSKGEAVYVANYGAGSVESFAVDGMSLSARSKKSPGKNAHAAHIDPSGKELYVPCLGSGYIARYTIGEKGLLTEASPANLDVGSKGPRHVAFHASKGFAYLMNEYEGSVQALKIEAGGPSLLGSRVPSTSASVAGNTGAEIEVHPNGKFLYSSNRGDDSIAIYTLDAQGLATFVKTVKTGGKVPRHFAIDPSGSWMTVANQGSDTVTLFAIDKASGDLTRKNTSLTFESPQFARIYDFFD